VPGVSAAAKGTAGAQVTNGILTPGMNSFLGTQAPISGAPKAYLNWVLLDEEQFKKVDVSCGVVPVPVINAGQEKQLLQANNGNEIEMTKNGYLYVFVSNESKGDVYFDDIRVEHIRCSLLEETHYYPFGLTMAGISSKAAGSLLNRRKFNDGTELGAKEFSDGSGLELYETPFRSYDAQIGRFHQIDPLANFLLNQSPYVYGNNNPISLNDPTGLLSDSTKPQVLQTVVVTAKDKPLKGGEYDGKLFSQIKERSVSFLGTFSSLKKEKFDNNKILENLKAHIKTDEQFAMVLKSVGTLAGGSSIAELKSIEDIKEIFKAIKSGKINPATLTLVVAASCLVMRGERSEKQAEQLTEIMNNYIGLHSSATTANPAVANGMYVIYYFSGSAGTGGGGMVYSETYYDIATNKFIGALHGTN
jgi:RHS repeat-associated protein